LKKNPTSILNESTKLSDTSATTIGNDIAGSRLLIIDEISMVGCYSLYEINRRLKAGLEYYYSKLPDLKNRIEILHNIRNLPFGGLHVLFSGKRIIITIIIIIYYYNYFYINVR
jgi:hypothetical protein